MFLPPKKYKNQKGTAVVCFNPLLTSVPFLFPLKNQKTYGFLMLSGALKREHQAVLGQVSQKRKLMEQ